MPTYAASIDEFLQRGTVTRAYMMMGNMEERRCFDTLSIEDGKIEMLQIPLVFGHGEFSILAATDYPTSNTSA